MRSSLSNILLCAAVTIVAMACTSRPDDVLDKESMAAVLADLHKGEGVVQSNQREFPSDSAKRVFRQSIFARHGVTSDDVYRSLDWYGYHIEQLDEVYARTVEMLEGELEEAKANIGSASELGKVSDVSMDGDSVDVWSGVRSRRFSRNMPSDFIRFDLNSDRYWDRGDVYTMRAKLIDTNRPVTYVIAVDYFDGSTEYLTRTLSGTGWQEVGMALDSAKVAHQIYGYIMYEPGDREVAYVDSISLMRTRWGGHYRYLRPAVKSMPRRR